MGSSCVAFIEKARRELLLDGRAMILLAPTAVVLVMKRRSLRSADDVSDEGLLAGLAVGDDQAALVFVRRYQRRLFGLAMGILGDAVLAEEVGQEAFLRIFRHAVMFDARRGSVTSWALTITRNLAIDALRVRRAVATDPDDQVFLTLVSSER